MLNFSEFKDYVQMTLAEVLPDELKDAQIRLNEVEREYPKVCVNLQTDVR